MLFLVRALLEGKNLLLAVETRDSARLSRLRALSDFAFFPFPGIFSHFIHSTSLQAGIDLTLEPASIYMLLISHLTGVLCVTARPKRRAIHANPSAPARPFF
jgi:hypothetical protein